MARLSESQVEKSSDQVVIKLTETGAQCRQKNCCGQSSTIVKSFEMRKTYD